MPMQDIATDLPDVRRKARWRPVFILTVAVAAVLISVWLMRAVAAPQSAALPATVAAERGSIEKVVTAQGRLQPREYVDVGAQVSGQVKRLLVSVGDAVKKGDLVAEIDAAVQQARVEAQRAQLDAQRAQLAEANAKLELAGLQFARQEKLHAADATSEEEFQISRAALRSADAQVDVLEAQIRQTESQLTESEAALSYTRIYAPMDGVVVALSARQGQTLNTNQGAPVLMRIADLSTMTVEAEVSEADISRLRRGMPVYFSPLGAPDERWHARLRQVLPTPKVSNNVVLYTALFDVDNADGRLMTDMTAQVSFVEQQAEDVVTVPSSSLIREGSRYQVRVWRDGRAEWRDVEVGVNDRIRAEIRHGLAAGEPVVVENLEHASGRQAAGRTVLRGFL